MKTTHKARSTSWAKIVLTLERSAKESWIEELRAIYLKYTRETRGLKRGDTSPPFSDSDSQKQLAAQTRHEAMVVCWQQILLSLNREGRNELTRKQTIQSIEDNYRDYRHTIRNYGQGRNKRAGVFGVTHPVATGQRFVIR